jgi:hypothetical protein
VQRTYLEPNNINFSFDSMKDKTYSLERYHGISSRHECPNCGDKRSFTYYVDEDGNILDKSVGRCNHESECGYNYTPKQWFKDNPTDYDRPAKMQYRFNRVHPGSIIHEPQKEPDYINPNFLIKSVSYDSMLVCYLCGLFSKETIQRVWNDYGVGATKDQSVIYWQIDINGNVRTGKVVKYNGETGHRIKDGTGVNWIHAIMKKKNLLSDSFNLVQCLFGEHLLKMYPNKPVALVEAEKTALVCSMVYPDYNWLATGGKSQLSFDKMKVLSGRKVIAFPDIDGFGYWQDKAKDLERHGLNINVSDYLQSVATDEDRKNKIDIADLILKEKETTPESELMLNRMIVANPFVHKLVKNLGLEVVRCAS